MEYLIIGIAMFANFAIIKIKLSMERMEDAIVDGAVLAIILYVSSGSLGGMQAGTVASALFSIFLLISPVKFFTKEN